MSELSRSETPNDVDRRALWADSRSIGADIEHIFVRHAMASKSFSNNPSSPGAAAMSSRTAPSMETLERRGPGAEGPEDLDFVGVFPPAELLKQYDDIEPGRAVRLLNLIEEQTRHRMEIERQMAKADIKRNSRVMTWGLGALLLSVFTGSYVVYDGHPAAGATIATTAVVGLIVCGVQLQKGRHQPEDEKDSRKNRDQE